MHAKNSGKGDLNLYSIIPIKSEKKSKTPKQIFKTKVPSKIYILKTKNVNITHDMTAYRPPTKLGVSDPKIAKTEIKIKETKIRFSKKSFFLRI